MTVNKSKGNEAFSKLDKKHQKAVKLLFEGTLTDEQISKEINRSTVTLWKWKNDPLFKQAQQEYAISVLDTALPDSVRELMKLINGKKVPAMVKLQAIQTVFKRAGLFSDNGTPELDKARIRKANADARVAEARANVAERLGSEGDDKLDELMEKLISASEKPKDQT